MRIAKIRRVGNSNVVSVPRELEKLGFKDGEEVLFLPLRNGEVRLLSSSRLQEYADNLALDIATRNKPALDLLAAYDRDEVDASLSQSEV